MKWAMETQLVEGVEVHRGSGNVFADLGLADAEKLMIKTGMVIEIRKAVKSRALTQQEAVKRMAITQSKVQHSCFVFGQGCALVKLASDLAVKLAHTPTAAQGFSFIELAGMVVFDR